MSKFTQYESTRKRLLDTMNELDINKVGMKGFHDDLLKLTPEVESLFDKYFYLGMSLDDAPYHGWTGEPLQDMRKVDREIGKRIFEIYAIILKATDSKIE